MAKKRKPNELLSSVVKESAPDGAFDLLLGNADFMLPNNIGIILTLNTVDPAFGGLSIKQKRQEDKGAIIEQIMGDRIEALVTKEMLDREVLGLIPTAQTLDNMADFSILVHAPYSWATVQRDDDGSLVIHDVGQATYEEARQISDQKVSLREVMPELWNWAAQDDTDEIEEASEVYEDAVESFEGFGGEDELDISAFAPMHLSEIETSPFGDDVEDMDTGEIAIAEAIASGEIPVVTQESIDLTSEPDWGDGDDYVEDVIEEEAPLDVEVIEEDLDDDAGDAAYEQYVAENADRDVTSEEVQDTIVRRFSPEDLDLVIDMSIFDSTFDSPPPHLTYTPMGSKWLDKQVSIMVDQANAELETAHWANLAALREKFVVMASRYGEEVAKRMSLTTKGARFEEMMAAAKQDYEEAKASSEKIAAGQREEIISRFENEANLAAEAAAVSAKARYEAQNRVHRERLLSEVSNKVDAQIEERFAANKNQLLELRSSEADNWFDLGLTRVIDTLVQESETQRSHETELLESWNNKITQFLDENRKADISRAEALAEAQSRRDQVNQMQLRFNAETKELHARNKQKIAEIENEMSQLRAKSLQELRERDEQWSSQLSAANQKLVQQTALSDSMRANLDSVRDVLTSQYEVKVQDLEREKAHLIKRMEDESKSASRTQRFVIMITVLIAILAILAGVIGGFVLGTGYNASAGASASSEIGGWSSVVPDVI